MNKNKQNQRLEPTSFRLDQEMNTKIIQVANNLGISTSEVRRAIFELGYAEFVKPAGKAVTPKVNGGQNHYATEAAAILHKNELILQGLHALHADNPVKVEQLLQFGFKMGCQTEEITVDAVRNVGRFSKERYKQVIRWIYFYGTMDLGDGHCLILNRGS